VFKQKTILFQALPVRPSRLSRAVRAVVVFSALWQSRFILRSVHGGGSVHFAGGHALSFRAGEATQPA
jgi:hypothetical protein